MRDFYGKQRKVMFLGKVTGTKFAEAYNELSLSENRVPVASTLIPVSTAMSGERGMTTVNDKVEGLEIFFAWIYFEEIPKQLMPKKELKTEL